MRARFHLILLITMFQCPAVSASGSDDSLFIAPQARGGEAPTTQPLPTDATDLRLRIAESEYSPHPGFDVLVPNRGELGSWTIILIAITLILSSFADERYRARDRRF